MKQSPVANVMFLYNKKAFLCLLRPPPPPPVEKKETFDEFARHLREISLDPWTLAAFNETEIRIVLHDSEHLIAKYILIIDSCLHFSLHVFNWLLPDQHKIYSSCRRRINSGRILELLQCLSNNKYKICEGYGKMII